MLTTEPTKELGKILFGSINKFKYILKNDYTESITITALVKGCNSCTTASINKQILSVGESAEIDVIYTPGSTGISNKTIIVQYEIGHSKKQDHITLNFKATVE